MPHFESDSLEELKTRFYETILQYAHRRINRVEIKLLLPPNSFFDSLDRYQMTENIQHILSGQTLVDIQTGEKKNGENRKFAVFYRMK
ncbi:MAG: hypothetical protein MI784_03095 [Cytophagales bacterium]|nr:hypothetical protein [Cytophagales bacterium]